MKKISGTILVSDKNRGLLTALVLLLQKYFSRVITEDNSGKIMELASTGEVDVVVLDAGGSNGRTFQETLDLTRRITSLNQDVQVVALTNFGQTEAAMKLADEGAFDFVVKPWNNEKLLITLRNAWLMRDMARTCRKAEWDYAVPAHDDKIEEKGKEKENEKEKIITLEQMEKKMMKAAIKRNRGNISNAAEELGITRQTLYNKGKKYKLFE